MQNTDYHSLPHTLPGYSVFPKHRFHTLQSLPACYPTFPEISSYPFSSLPASLSTVILKLIIIIHHLVGLAVKASSSRAEDPGFESSMTRPRRKSRLKRDSNPGSSALEADALTIRPTRRSLVENVLPLRNRGHHDQSSKSSPTNKLVIIRWSLRMWHIQETRDISHSLSVYLNNQSRWDTRTHARTHTRVCAHTPTHPPPPDTHTYTYARAREHARTHVRTHTHTRARTHARTHAHAHTHAYIHTPYSFLNGCSGARQKQQNEEKPCDHLGTVRAADSYQQRSKANSISEISVTNNKKNNSDSHNKKGCCCLLLA